MEKETRTLVRPTGVVVHSATPFFNVLKNLPPKKNPSSRTLRVHYGACLKLSSARRSRTDFLPSRPEPAAGGRGQNSVRAILRIHRQFTILEFLGLLPRPACVGSGGQKIWIVPSRKLTISSFSLTDKFKNSRSEYKIIS
jgi:hypothetical protein